LRASWRDNVSTYHQLHSTNSNKQWWLFRAKMSKINHKIDTNIKMTPTWWEKALKLINLNRSVNNRRNKDNILCQPWIVYTNNNSETNEYTINQVKKQKHPDRNVGGRDIKYSSQDSCYTHSTCRWPEIEGQGPKLRDAHDEEITMTHKLVNKLYVRNNSHRLVCGCKIQTR
jgi:hypothetical protein